MLNYGGRLAALVLAAGLSRRMGSFKLLLPWQGKTVIGQVIATLQTAGLEEVVVVTGYRAEEIAAVASGPGVRTVFNPLYAGGEMISSIRAGLVALEAAGEAARAALLCLGDQPQMLPATVQVVAAAGNATGWESIIVPSYQKRAGHPVLLPRRLWPEVTAGAEHLRAVLTSHREATVYVDVDTATILSDLDTPEQYAASKP